MTEQCEKIKTKPTALAQLVAIHMANGITSTKALSDETGYSDRAIRKAKAELECRNYSSARNQSAAHPGTIVPQAEPECRNQSAAPRARAYKEFPSGIVIQTEENNNNTPALSQLNGSADVVVGLVKSWMPGLYQGEMAPARNWVQTLILETSSDAVKSAVLQTANRMQSGELIPKPLHYASKTARGIHASNQQDTKQQQQAPLGWAERERARQREALEILERLEA